jgi:CheY-like chemotaxis protein
MLQGKYLTAATSSQRPAWENVLTIEQAFGKAVRRLRKERNMSQETLALTSKLDRTFISLIECGKKNPTLITIFQLSSGLNVPTEMILRDVESIMRMNGIQSVGKEAVADQEIAKQQQATPPVAEIIKKYNLANNETILLVEDEEVTRDFLTLLLKRVGYSVIVAHSGHEAVALYMARQREISLIIMDVVIPTCNGVEAANLIRDKYPLAKVLFISGYDLECLNIPPGKFPFFKKPLKPLPFVNQVRTMLEA